MKSSDAVIELNLTSNGPVRCAFGKSFIGIKSNSRLTRRPGSCCYCRQYALTSRQQKYTPKANGDSSYLCHASPVLTRYQSPPRDF